jgi:hypothetical protein
VTEIPRSGAHFSRCRTWRYALWREWDASRPRVMLVGLNPSTADAKRDDPTIRRCIGFARDWGFGGVWVLNLFAFRATEPADLKAADDPVGARNDQWLRRVARRCGRIVACWGNHGAFLGRSARVRAMLGDRLEVIRLNASGEPAHPLYLPKTLKPSPWAGL